MIIPYFKTDFYLNFYNREKLSSFNTYVHHLAQEYFQLFCLYKARKVTFLYHTLNWEHASSLSLAIQLIQKKFDVNHQHLACLMYNPCSSLNGKKEQRNRCFKFNVGFKALSQIPKVKLFSTEFELAENYRRMLGSVIESSPCGLISQQHFQEINKYKKESPRILLYLGDAKENKGFSKLPDLVKTLTESIYAADVKFIIQYTITNSCSDLSAVDEILKQWSIKDRRIQIQDRFLTQQEMHNLWLSTTHVVFNYDKEAYCNQSSGVLWQAAAYKANIYLMTDSWLNREARRLNCTYWYVKTLNQLQVSLQNSIATFPKKKKNSVDGKNEYRDSLFSDFAYWLLTQIKVIKRGTFDQ